jgi:hypothetical protein
LSAQVANTAAGGLITISIPAGIVLTPDGAAITINGVRGTVTGFAVGSDVNASIQSTPSNAHSFVNVSTVRVARTNQGLVVTYNGTVQTICNGGPDPSVTLAEGFPGAFVQHVTSADGAVVAPVPNARTLYGGTANTQFHIQVVGIPANVSVVWPATQVASLGTGTLHRIGPNPAIIGGVQDVVYEFTTSDQGLSDIGIESFTVTADVGVSTSSGVGQVVSWTQLYPAPAPITLLMPRFNDPFQPNPPANFVLISKCVTYLLFPFMSNAAGSTFDSGIAIANTSSDDAAFGGPLTGATAQTGDITLYGWQYFTPGGTAPAVIAQTVVSSLEAGNTWAGSLSGITGFAGFQGYIIAVAQFQYAHGFAFLSGTYGSSVPVVAEGYLANIIPDPNVSGTRAAAPPNPAQAAGENLGQ